MSSSRWGFRIPIHVGGTKEWFERSFNEGEKEKNVGAVKDKKETGVSRDHMINWTIALTTQIKITGIADQEERNGNHSERGLFDGGDGSGDEPEFTNPVCVGAGDTTCTVVKSLSSASNRARVSARYVARLISHLASHSESTVT